MDAKLHPTDAAATSSPSATIDAAAVRAGVPILEMGPNTGRSLAYLDSASSAMKPRAVIDSIVETYEHTYANVHRGVYAHAAETTSRFEAVRERVRALLNARSPREVIFTRGTTEAINLVAQSWGRANLGPGDIVVTTELEHHSNLVPWQQACLSTGAELRFIPVDDDGVLDLSSLDQLAAGGLLRMVTLVHVSNSLGTIAPLDQIVPWARSHGALVLLDAAQSVPHQPVDVQALDVDFLAWSAHKLMGPTGAGALWAREELLQEMPPWQHGGEMIRRVQYESSTFNDLPWKFEAGTPAIAEVIGTGAAIDHLHAIGGMAAIAAHDHQLVTYGHERLLEVPGVRVLGPPVGQRRGGVLSFVMDGTHPHDIATLLDQHDVNVRAGHHCTQPLMQRLGVHATARASVYAYNVPDDLDRLVDGLHDVRRVFGLV